MSSYSDDFDDEIQENPERRNAEHLRNIEIQKMFKAIEMEAKKTINYMQLEGFIEPTDRPGVYKYTPEGLVLAKQRYKKLRDEGKI
jgi:hypothetical protein